MDQNKTVRVTVWGQMLFRKTDGKCFPKVSVRPEVALKVLVRLEVVPKMCFPGQSNRLSVELWYEEHLSPERWIGWLDWCDSSRYLIKQLY